MTHPLPTFPPLLPSGEWWRHFFVAGGDVAAANSRCGLRAREWMRFSIAAPAAPNESDGHAVTLSVPVAGGASALKNHAPASWELAPRAEADWRKILATVATLYGRAPFFEAVFDRLAALSPLTGPDLTPAGIPAPPAASAICSAALDAACDFLSFSALMPRIGALVADGDVRLRQVCREAAAKFSPSLSILDALMRLGPDAIFALVPPF